MKLSPGLAVISTTMRSDRTLVPPVTELRSPPDSRITGADSPVMADSSTLATPSTTSPSPGMISPATTTTRSPRVSPVAGTFSTVPSLRSRLAMVSVLALRRLAAWALPRPSATASARLAKMTVIHSQIVTHHANALGAEIASTVHPAAPTSTTNMTGLWTMTRGSSLRIASGSEVRNIFGSIKPAWTREGGVGVATDMAGGPSGCGGVWGSRPLVVVDITGPPPAGRARGRGSTSGRPR